jgi:transposase InsO family protein
MVSCIDRQRETYGFEPICKLLPIAPSTNFKPKAVLADPARRSRRALRDEQLRPELRRVWDDNFHVYGVRKVWRQLRRDGVSMARCTVTRLMRQMGLRGVVRGRSFKTTIPALKAKRPLDLVKRNFKASRPNQLWEADLTYVATWKGFVDTAFVIDVFSRQIVGWRVATTLRSDLALDALEQAIHARKIGSGQQLVHHSDRGTQYLCIRYSERLAEAGIEPSVGSVEDSYDKALAESVIGVYKNELMRQRGSWRTADAVEYETLRWVDWFNTRRLLEPIGSLPPLEFENAFYDHNGPQTEAS